MAFGKVMRFPHPFFALVLGQLLGMEGSPPRDYLSAFLSQWEGLLQVRRFDDNRIASLMQL